MAATIEAQAPEFTVNSGTIGLQEASAAARLANGNTVVTWFSTKNGGDI